MRAVDMKEGILYVDGKRVFALSADYPYYRDDPANWSDRLDSLKEAHIGVVSFYVPWRHHAVDGRIDFEGSTAPNRNVKAFIRLCREKDLLVLLKPGPFIHAETDFGGLPDFVDPERDTEIDPMLSGKGEVRRWHKALPSPTDAKFTALIEEWFRCVDRELIEPNTYPKGPIIALQILNEGVYSDAQHPVTEYDYSVTSIERFQSYIEHKYGSIEKYNELHATTYVSFADVQPPRSAGALHEERGLLSYLDWSDYQSYYMASLYSGWGGFIRSELPYILNLNPPHDREQGYDDWFNRLEIERFDNQNYGYTNWIGVVSHDETAFNRYLLLTKRGRGPNLEENWGFSKLYDYRYNYTAIPFFQTVMAVAGGATGYNIYTGVSTDKWDGQIDSMQQKPYPDCSPITANGERTAKYYSMKLLNRFFAEYGEELMECDAYAPLTWGIYNGYAHAGCWGMEEQIQALGRKPVRLGKEGFDRFQSAVRKENIDYSMVNITSGGLSPIKHPAIVLAGGFYMAEQAQKNIVDYVKRGGTLLLTHDVPVLNEFLRPCDLLKNTLFGEGQPVDGTYKVGQGKLVYAAENWFADETSTARFLGTLKQNGLNCFELTSEAQTWVHRHPRKDVQYVFVLGLSDQEQTYVIQYRDQTVEIDLPKKSSAILRLEQGRLTAGVIKGEHEFEQSYRAPLVRYGEEELSASAECDLFFRREGERFEAEAASTQARESVSVTWHANGKQTTEEVRLSKGEIS